MRQSDLWATARPCLLPAPPATTHRPASTADGMTQSRWRGSRLQQAGGQHEERQRNSASQLKQ